MNKHDRISGIFFLAFGLFVVCYAPRFGLGSMGNPDSGFMSFISGLVICGSSVWVLSGAFFGEQMEPEAIWADISIGKLVFTVLLIFAFAYLLRVVGFVLSSFFLILPLMRYIGSQTWLNSVIGAALSSFVTHLLFGVWLKVHLPKGFLGF